MSLSTSGQLSLSHLNSALRITNGNVGVGTTAPSYTLDVNGDIRSTSYTGGYMFLSGGVNAIDVSVAGNIAATGTLINGGFDFYLGDTDQVSRGDSGASRALVKGGSNILILNFNNDFSGGTEIGSTFKVSNDVNTKSSTESLVRYILSNTTGSVEMGIKDAGVDNGSSYLLDLRPRDLRIGTNNTSRITIASSGNIGIGTTAPGEVLDIRGNLRVGNSTQSNYIVFSGVQGDGQGSWNHTYIGERLYGGNDYSELLLFKGNDPFTTSGPDRIRLLAPEIDFDTYTAFVAGSFDGISTYGTTQMSILTSGSICMGTTRASAKLNIGGGIDMDNGSTIRGYGTGPLYIDPNFTSNNYIQMNDEVRIDSDTIFKSTSATMGSTVVSNQLTISATNQPLLRFERSGTGFWDFEITLDSTTADYIFRGRADGTGASLTELVRIQASSGIVSTGSINISGQVTVGTLIANSSVNRTLAYVWLNNTGNTGVAPSQTNAYSVYAAARTAAGEFMAYSDERIKNNIVDVNDTSALETLRQIQPKRYTYIDTATKGETPVWGFIAQQVGSVLDYSVNKVEEYIPNMYSKASVTNNTDGSILTLVNGTTSVLDISKAPEDKLQIRIHIDSEKECMKEVYVKEILNTNQVRIEDNLDVSITEVFVYGQKVNDFHALNKDAIFTVSVAALQEVDRELQDMKNSLSDEQSSISTLTQQLNDITTRLVNANL